MVIFCTLKVFSIKYTVKILKKFENTAFNLAAHSVEKNKKV